MHGKTWEAPDLTQDWAISIEQGPALNIKQLVESVRPILALLEGRGRKEIHLSGDPSYRRLHANDPSDPEASAEQALWDVGVKSVVAWGPRRSDPAHLPFIVRGGAGGDSGRMNQLVTREAIANVEKLNAADGDERHLFIWLNPSEMAAEMAFSLTPPPDETPQLPAGIDVVWLAGRGTPGHGAIGLSRLLRLAKGRSWEVLDPAVAP